MPSPWLILYGLLGTLAGFLVLELLAARFISEQKLRGIFVQGSFRGQHGDHGAGLCAKRLRPRRG